MGKLFFSRAMHPCRAFAACAVLSLSLAAALPAVAAPVDAETAAQLAVESYRAGDFEVAAKLFMQAYAKSHKPDAVFNAARAYQSAGKRGDAAGLFRLYISLATDVAGTAEARKHLAALEVEAPQKPIEPTQKPVEAPKSVVVVDRPAVAAIAPQPPVLVEKPAEVQAPPRTLGYALVASGAALAATGLGLGIWAAIDRADLQSQVALDAKSGLVERVSYSAATQRNSAIFSRSIWAGVLGGVGVGAAATGGWQLWHSPGSGAKAALVPAPGGASLAVRF